MARITNICIALAAGLNVSVLHGQPPDADLKLFHVAEFFVPAKYSGFSNLAVQARSYRGPNVLEAALVSLRPEVNVELVGVAL